MLKLSLEKQISFKLPFSKSCFFPEVGKVPLLCWNPPLHLHSVLCSQTQNYRPLC